MIIPDTSIWVEYFRANEPTVSKLEIFLEQAAAMALPWIFGELLQGAKNERETKTVLQVWRALPKPEQHVGELAWIRAGEESFKGKWHSKGIGLIDAAILVVAMEYKFKVWTLDKRLLGVLKFRKLAFEN